MQGDRNDTADIREWYLNIGRNITWFRRRRGLTQENLADLVGISRAHLASIEAPHSDRRPSMDLVFHIAQALEVSPEDLLKTYDKPPEVRQK